MFSTNFLSEFVYCILNCYAHMNILQMEYAHYKCKLLLLLLLQEIHYMYCHRLTVSVSQYYRIITHVRTSENHRFTAYLYQH